MPNAVINKHTFTCNHCDWVKCGDRRTLKHAVALHAKLVHGVINELPDLIQKVQITKSEWKHQTAKRPNQTGYATIV